MAPALLAAALLLAQPAASGAPGLVRAAHDPDTCIETIGQPDWVPLDDHTLLVTSGVRSFRVDTDSCPPLHRAFPTITTENLGGGSICAPHDVRLYASSGGDPAPMYCSIRSITPVTADEARALAARKR